MRQLRLRDSKRYAQDHIARKWQSWDSNEEFELVFGALGNYASPKGGPGWDLGSETSLLRDLGQETQILRAPTSFSLKWG